MTEDHPDAPDIYSSAKRPECCDNCRFCAKTVLRTLHGIERTECECERRAEFVHRTQAEARCNYWEAER